MKLCNPHLSVHSYAKNISFQRSTPLLLDSLEEIKFVSFVSFVFENYDLEGVLCFAVLEYKPV